MLVNKAYVCNNFSLIKEAIEEADENDLAIFDVDHVIMMPTNEHTLNRNPDRKKLWEDLRRRCSPEQARSHYGETFAKTEWCLVDPDILTVIEALESSNIPAIALSSIYTGKFGIVEKIEDWRIKQLQDIGFDFSQLSKGKFNQELLLHDLASSNGVPMLKKGVILTAQADKGMVLERVLRAINYRPKKIIYIDDNKENIRSVAFMSLGMGIEFIGFIYTAVEQMPVPKISMPIEKKRFEILESEGEWLNYAQLGRRMISKEQQKPIFNKFSCRI